MPPDTPPGTPPDAELVSETRAWFAKADVDLRAADCDFGASPPLLSDIVFHCQRAAEKAMKGLLTWQSRPFRKTHSLEELGEQCLAVCPGLREVIDPAVPLTEYATRFRYPGEPEEPTLEEAQEALRLARRLHDAILSLLPQEARP